MRTVAKIVDGVSAASFYLSAALYPVLVAVIVINVCLRYGFSIGSIELEELQWHIYSAAFLLGFAQVFRTDANVRVDFFSRRFSERTKLRLEIVALMLLLLPFLAIFTYFAFLYFQKAWILNEVSPHSSGLPARFIIKFVLFFAFLSLLLQVLVTTAKRVSALRAGGSATGED